MQIKLLTQLPPRTLSPRASRIATLHHKRDWQTISVSTAKTHRDWVNCSREGSGELGKAAPIVVQQLTKKRVKEFIPKNLLLCFAFFQRVAACARKSKRDFRYFPIVKKKQQNGKTRRKMLEKKVEILYK